MIVRTLLAVAALCALAPSPASAEATGPCHCYRERTFDPERPGAADPYILATSRSSLLSAAWGRSKRELIQAVMTGTSPDDLWIADWAAARTGRSSSALLEAKGGTRSWRAALAAARGLGQAFDSAMLRGSSDADLAALAVDDVLVTRTGTDASAVATVRAAGASTSEAILAVVLAARLHTNPVTVFEPVKAGKATWGVVLQGLGLTPKDIDGVVREVVAVASPAAMKR